MRSIILTAAPLMLLAVPNTLPGQQGTLPLEPEQRVRFETPSLFEGWRIGKVARVTPHTLVPIRGAYTGAGSDEPIPVAALARIQVSEGRKSHAGKGAWIGALGGFVLGVATGFPGEHSELMAQQTGADVLPADQCPKQLADLYARGTLDALVELATAIYEDMYDNSERYRQVPSTVLTEITQFERVGRHENWPDKERRAQIYREELGPYEVDLGSRQTLSGRPFEFHARANTLREAAREFFREPRVSVPERNVSSIRTAVTAIRAYLLRRCGSGLSVNVANLDSIFRASTDILKEPSIARVFDAQPITGTEPPARDWPLGGPVETDVTQLIAAELRSRLSPEAVNMLLERFTNLQLVAKFGSNTIKAVLEDKWDDWETAEEKRQSKFYAIIEGAGKWGKALERYHTLLH